MIFHSDSPNVSLSGEMSPPTGTVHVVGQTIQIYDRLSDGTLVLKTEKFVPKRQSINCLQDIWTTGREQKYAVFISEAIRNGLVNDWRWQYGSVSITCCYKYLSSPAVGLLKPNLPWTEVFKAFTGTYSLPKVKHARSLQDRNNKTQAYRRKEKYWQRFFNDRFFFGQ